MFVIAHALHACFLDDDDDDDDDEEEEEAVKPAAKTDKMEVEEEGEGFAVDAPSEI